MLKTFACLATFMLATISFSQVNGFEKNLGQIANEKGEVQSDVQFKARIGNAHVYFYNDHVSYYFKKKSDLKHLRGIDMESLSYEEIDRLHAQDTTWFYRLDLDFIGGKAEKVSGSSKMGHYANYFLSHCPDGISNVPFFEEIIYHNVYEGVDYRFQINSDGLKYDIHAKKGADLSQIQFRYNGHKGLKLENNQLHMKSPFGDMVEDLPASYVLSTDASPFTANPKYTSDRNDWNGEQNPIKIEYQISEDGIISFFTDEKIESAILIDPKLIWSSYYLYEDASFGQEMDAAAGQVVNVSTTADNLMPTLDPGASAYFQSSPNQPSGMDPDLRILQFTEAGVLQWATYYGGELNEYARGGVEINPTNGDIFIAAASTSLSFPTLDMGGGAWFENTNVTAEQQIVLLRFTSTGVRTWATYFNANLAANPFDVALSATGEFYVVGDNGSGGFIPTQTLVGAYNQGTQSPNSATDSEGILISFDPNGVFRWGTYFGDDNAGFDINESFKKVEIAPNGKIYVAGTIDEATSIVQDAGGFYDPGYHGGTDLILVRFSSSGSLEWSTLMGGAGNEPNVYGLSADENNNIFVSAVSGSGAFPTVDPGNGAYFDNALSGIQSATLSKFNDNTDLVWSTYIGSANIEFNSPMEVSDNNKVYFAAYSNGPSGLPVMNKLNSFNQATGSGSNSGFIAQFDTSGVQEWGTYISSNGSTKLQTVATYDGVCGDQVYFGGEQSDDLYPVLNPGGAYVQNYPGSGTNLFTISQFNDNLQDPSWTSPSGVCENSPAVSLNTFLTGDAGGTWTGNGVSGGVFDPSGISDSALVTYTLGTGQCIDSLQQTIYIDSLSVIPTNITASFTDICPGQNTTLTINGGSLGTGADWFWYSGSCGNNPEGNGASIIVSPATTTTYYARGEGTCGNTACVAITITVKTLSNAPTGVSNFLDPVCIGDSTYIAPIGGSLGTNADWYYYEGSCGGTLLGTGDSLAVHPTSATDYYIQAIGDCNSTVCQMITVNTADPSVDPTGISAVDTIICAGGFTTLSIVGGTLGTSADWEWYTGTCGGTAAGTGTSLVVSPATTTTYFARAEGYCGNTVCVQLTIEVQSQSTNPTSINAVTNPICDGDSTVLTVNGGTLGAGAEWIWYTGGCGTTPVDTGVSITVTPTSATTYFVRAENTCNTTSCVQITVNVAPAGDASWNSPGTICESIGPVDMDQFITGNTGGSWFGTNIAGSFFNPAGLTGQSVTLSYTQGSGNCIDTVSYVINITATVSASWTSPGNICETNGLVDMNQFVTGSTGGTWTGTGITGNMFDPDGLTGSIALTYTVGVAPSCVDQSTLNVTVITGPPAPTASATNTAICEGDTTTLSATGSGATVNYHVYDAATGGTLLGDTDLDVNPSTTTTYYIQGEDHNGCFHDGALIPITITVTPAPLANAGADETICEGSSVNLTASGGTDYLWNTGETTASITVGPANDSIYSVLVTDIGTGCSARDSLLVTVVNLADITADDDAATVDVGVATTINIMANDVNGDPATLTTLNGPNYGTAVYSGSDMIYTSNSDFVGYDTVIYTVCHPSCANICDTAMVRIFVTSGLEAQAPTGFSPNGDGINDAFVVLGLENYPEAELQVFNRWGEMVYQSANYANDWMGESNGPRTLAGDQVPDGTYFFILKLGDEFDTINGHVEVKRQ